MHVFGIGIDVIEVERITDAIRRHGERFLSRVFTAAEQRYCESRKNPSLHYAARFAAKEAASKALGTGIGANAGWLDLEIENTRGGTPHLTLHGPAAAFSSIHGITQIHVSLSHARDFAAANAVALCLTPNPSCTAHVATAGLRPSGH